jgi:hypothetical protein
VNLFHLHGVSYCKNNKFCFCFKGENLNRVLNFEKEGGKSEEIWDIDSGLNDYNAGLGRVQQEEYRFDPSPLKLLSDFQYQSYCRSVGTSCESDYIRDYPGGDNS